MAGWKSRDSVPELVKEYLAGRLKVDEFVTHSLPLSKINDAFDLMHHGQRFAFCVTFRHPPTHTICVCFPAHIPELLQINPVPKSNWQLWHYI